MCFCWMLFVNFYLRAGKDDEHFGFRGARAVLGIIVLKNALHKVGRFTSKGYHGLKSHYIYCHVSRCDYYTHKSDNEL